MPNENRLQRYEKKSIPRENADTDNALSPFNIASIDDCYCIVFLLSKG